MKLMWSHTGSIWGGCDRWDIDVGMTVCHPRLFHYSLLYLFQMSLLKWYTLIKDNMSVSAVSLALTLWWLKKEKEKEKKVFKKKNHSELFLLVFSLVMTTAKAVTIVYRCWACWFWHPVLCCFSLSFFLFVFSTKKRTFWNAVELCCCIVTSPWALWNCWRCTKCSLE